MSRKIDPTSVLLELAGSLDVGRTISRFPGLTRESLSEILKEAAGLTASPEEEVVVMVDGAARGNPGPAGAGFLVMGRGWTTVRRGEYLGEATNNVAEYQALLFGLEEAVKAGAVRVRICSDSELLVKQMTGEYRVKNPRLKDLFMRAQRMASNLKDVTYSHIPREENKEADRLANMAIDAEGPVSL